MRTPGQGPEGLALVLTLLLLLGLTVLAHGALVLARGHGRGAEALRDATAARLEARVRLLARSAALAADTPAARPPGSVDTLAGGAVLERLTDEFLLLGVAAADRPRATGQAAWSLLWAAHPVTRVAATGAVVAAGGAPPPETAVLSGDFFGSRPADGSGCDPWRPALDSLAAALPGPDATGPLDREAGGAGEERPALAMGLLPGDSVLARLGALDGGVVSPRPALGATTCIDAPDNWGSPADPDGPCGSRRVAFAVEGPLEMAGGEGQGLLAVTGDVVLGDGALFAGLLLVAGDLTVREGSLLRGAARVGGDVRVSGGGEVRGAACPVVLALAGAPGLRRPVRVPGPVLRTH